MLWNPLQPRGIQRNPQSEVYAPDAWTDGDLRFRWSPEAGGVLEVMGIPGRPLPYQMSCPSPSEGRRWTQLLAGMLRQGRLPPEGVFRASGPLPPPGSTDGRGGIVVGMYKGEGKGPDGQTGGKWVTMHGRHVYIDKDGQMVNPPKGMAGETNSPKQGDRFDLPAQGQRSRFQVEVTHVDGDTAHVSYRSHPGDAAADTPFSESDKNRHVKMPAASVKHFVNDLSGRVDGTPDSRHQAVNAVLRGEGQFLGKGDDGVVFRVGDQVVKVSTTVPYQPTNAGHLTPEAAADRLMKQADVMKQMRSEGIPGIPEVEALRHGDKAFMVMPFLDIPEGNKLTEEQFEQLTDSVKALHKQGWRIRDTVQAGIGKDGRVYQFDLGKAAKYEAGTQAAKQYAEDDLDHLRSVQIDSGIPDKHSSTLEADWEEARDPMWMEIAHERGEDHRARISELYRQMLRKDADDRRRDPEAHKASGRNIIKELGEAAKAWKTLVDKMGPPMKKGSGSEEWRTIRGHHILLRDGQPVNPPPWMKAGEHKEAPAAPAHHSHSLAAMGKVRDFLHGDPSASKLLKTPYKALVEGGACKTTGHCYAASEALYHHLGGKEAGWTPQSVQHEGGPHWFLKHKDGTVLDPTHDQFKSPVPVHQATGKGFLTKEPSKRALAIMERAGLSSGNAKAASPPIKWAHPGKRSGEHRERQLVNVDVGKVEQAWRKVPNFYIGDGGKGGIGNRYQRATEHVLAGGDMDAPLFSVGLDGEPHFGDGRHRFAVARDLGHKTVPMAVHPEDVAEVRAKYGADDMKKGHAIKPRQIVVMFKGDVASMEPLTTGSYSPGPAPRSGRRRFITEDDVRARARELSIRQRSREFIQRIHDGTQDPAKKAAHAARLEAYGPALAPPPGRQRKEKPFTGSITFQGIPIAIESEKGTWREGVGRDGKPWRVKMNAHYGEIHGWGTLGTDGDKLDAYVGPVADASHAYVIDQLHPDSGAFDEQKVMLGFPSESAAKAAYLAQFDKPGFYGGIHPIPMDVLKAKLRDKGLRGQPISHGRPVVVLSSSSR